MIGVIKSIGIVIAIKTVWSCVIVRVNIIALELLINNDRNVPTHVGHAINKPVVAPILANPLPFFVNDIIHNASDTLKATRYDTTICNRRFIGIICNPTCSVIYTIIFGI